MTNVQHKNISKGLMKVIDGSKGVVMQIEIIPVVYHINLPNLSWNCVVSQYCRLYFGQSRVKLIITSCCLKEVIIRISLEG